VCRCIAHFDNRLSAQSAARFSPQGKVLDAAPERYQVGAVTSAAKTLTPLRDVRSRSRL
jgi:hypothetical protein